MKVRAQVLLGEHFEVSGPIGHHGLLMQHHLNHRSPRTNARNHGWKISKVRPFQPRENCSNS